MIWMFSFARSGSSLIQDGLCEAFGYAKVFEPFGFKPERCSDSETFEFVCDYFRGAPDPSELHRYRVQDYYVGHVPRRAFGSPEIKPYKEKLGAYLSEMYDKYGDAVVVKCVRQLGNIPFLDSILREIGVTPRYILLYRDPFEIAYSYYRLGGLLSSSSWKVAPLFEYHKRMYLGEDAFLDALFDRARSNLDRLICCIQADYSAFNRVERELESLRIEYETFIRSPSDEVNRIRRFAGVKGDSVPGRTFGAAHFNLSQRDGSVSDSLFSLLAWRTTRRLFHDRPEHRHRIDIRKWRRPRLGEVRFWLRHTVGSSRGS
jgi:hypothetical protein